MWTHEIVDIIRIILLPMKFDNKGTICKKGGWTAENVDRTTIPGGVGKLTIKLSANEIKKKSTR